MAKEKTKSAETKSTETNSIAQMMSVINKQYGEGAVMRGRGSIVKVESYSTKVASLDLALGCRGIPRGRIIELYGSEGSGKTTTALQFIVACQSTFFESRNRKGVAAFIDAENALDITWAENIGVNSEDLLISQPSSGEEALQIAEIMAKSRSVDLVIIDSVAALTPKAELDGEIGDTTIGAQARLMSQAMRKLAGDAYRSGTTLVFINQIRSKIGVTFGNPEITPGGRALKFYSSIRIEISQGGKIKENDVVIGFRPTAKIVKNKLGYPFQSASYDICVGRPERPIYGIDTIASLFDVAVDHKLIEQNSSFYRYDGVGLGNGRSNGIAALRANPEWVAKLERQIYTDVLGGSSTETKKD